MDVSVRFPDLDAKLDTILSILQELKMAAIDMMAVLARIDNATTNIAGDITRLKAQISTQMSEADVAAVQAGLDAAAARLEGMANDPENPDPAAP